MADDFKTALSTPLPEGIRRILLVISWPTFILVSLFIVVAAVALLVDSGYVYPHKDNPFAGIEEIRPDGTKYVAAYERYWAFSNIHPGMFLLLPGAVIGVFVLKWACFKALSQLAGYIWSVLLWVGLGFKKQG